jgi:hypothetical protein
MRKIKLPFLKGEESISFNPDIAQSILQVSPYVKETQ